MSQWKQTKEHRSSRRPFCSSRPPLARALSLSLSLPSQTPQTLTVVVKTLFLSKLQKNTKNRYFPGAKAAAAARRPSVDGVAGASTNKPRKRELQLNAEGGEGGAEGVKVKRKRKNGKR